jgi:hypothetical protein
MILRNVIQNNLRQIFSKKKEKKRGFKSQKKSFVKSL